MKIIDAFWEKRNLGVDCKEIVISETDAISEVEQVAALVGSVDYLVVKVPVGRFDVNSYLASLGFTFVEASINLRLQMKDAVLSPLQQRLNTVIGYEEMNNADLDQLFLEIDKGLFATDRILLDPVFSSAQAANRYVNWIKDELSRKSQAYKIVYKGDSIGFFTFKMLEDGVYYPFLAGMYSKYSNSGLGFATLRKPTEEVIRREGKMISTYVSSNNNAVIRTHLRLGFTVHEMSYVYIKHKK